MIKALLYIPAITFLITIITDILARVYFIKGKKIILNINSYDCILKMLNLKRNQVDNIPIEKSKNYYYHLIKNCIGIKNFDSKAVSEVIPSLHECGDYLSINKSISKCKIFFISQVIVSLNRLIIIPLFLLFALDIIKINLLSMELFLTILLVIFFLASFLRLFVGIYEEYSASKLAINYIDNNFDKNIKDYSIKLLLMSFLSQSFLSLTIIISIPIIYLLLLSIS
ncbi:MAG: hypothetical protein ACTH0S_11975 [Senegalia sp. (in: firmicutes)]